MNACLKGRKHGAGGVVASEGEQKLFCGQILVQTNAYPRHAGWSGH
jgi:hypothetical protein